MFLGSVRRGSAPLLAAILLIPLVTVLPQPASASQSVFCGAEITESVRLEADLDCSDIGEGTALTITGDNVILDLNGHTIFGPKVTGVGIVIQRASNVIVKDGSILGFRFGIIITTGAARNTVKEMTIRSDSAAVLIQHKSDDNVVKENAFIENPRAAVVIAFDSDNNVVKENLFLRNALTSEGGTLRITRNSDGTIVKENLFQDNRLWALFIADDPEVEGSADVPVGTIVVENEFVDTEEGFDQIHCRDEGFDTVFRENEEEPDQDCPP